jgi:predicted transposase YbfD/YdcC
MQSFKVTNVNDLELIYSILRERYPNNEIGVLYNWNIKEYTISVTDKIYKYDPEIPVDINIQVVYGDSVTGDTPLLLKKHGLVYIETIGSIFDVSKKEEYPGFKMFDKTIRLEKEFSTTDYQIWSDIGWVDIKKVIRHRCDKKIYRVLTHTGCVDVTEDHSLIGDTLEPIKPTDLKIGDSLLHSFPSEFIENNETIKNIIKTININDTIFNSKSKIKAQCIYYFLRSIGFNPSIDNINDNFIINKIDFQKIKETVVKKIIDKGTTNDYVYDIETDIGRFACGVGQLNGFNTDSVFLRFKYNRDDFERNRKDTFRLALICGDNLTDSVFKRPPICLEFEKVFHPFILLTKKRYIANKFENVKDPFQLKGVDAKGIALTRRDYCPMVKKCYKEIIDTIVNDKTATGEMVKNDYDSLKKSTELYKQYIDNIYNYNIDIQDLVVSAMLAASYKTRPVHVQLAERLKLRKQEVQVGDRIPYIFIESDDAKRAKSELGEDPKYAIENNLKYNRTCYIEQLAKPILGFYKIALKDREDLLDEIINYTNNTLIKCGGRSLKPSDFKIDE